MRLPPRKPNPELDALIERARQMPPMTPAQIKEQRISFAYGQMMDCAPHLTKDDIRAIDDATYGVPSTIALTGQNTGADNG